jgi:hypothetical protein
MKDLTTQDKLFFFERHFFTLDGLWMIETENKLDWDTALEIDLDVWKKLLKIIFRRIKTYLKIDGNTLSDLVKILTFRWAAEGWDYTIENLKKNEIHIEIRKCPYKSAMDRNPERHDKIPLICNNMCRPFYKDIVSSFNSEIKVNRDNFMGLGDELCDFSFSIQNDKDLDELGEDLFYTKNTIQDEDKLFYFERNFRTLDGLWVIEIEEKTDFKSALEIDLIVWQRLYEIVFRRVKKYLSNQGDTLDDLTTILYFIWSCEGNSPQIIRQNDKEVLIEGIKCPYVEAMLRNPERTKRIESICTIMCVGYLKPVIKQFNPNIKLKRTRFIGLGDNSCDFLFKLER